MLGADLQNRREPIVSTIVISPPRQKVSAVVEGTFRDRR
jgi:hypothetical protein